MPIGLEIKTKGAGPSFYGEVVPMLAVTPTARFDLTYLVGFRFYLYEVADREGRAGFSASRFTRIARDITPRGTRSSRL